MSQSYPLPGETVTRTLTAVEFGMGRPRDEPAPPEISELFREMQAAFNDMGSAHQEWRADQHQVSWLVFRQAVYCHENLRNALLRALRSHRAHCYTCDGHRFWLHVEPGGCRRNIIRIEEL